MTGVLLMAYGTPRGLDEVEAFYTDIRGGRKPPPQMLANLRSRYQTIGGRTPLLDITQAQAEALEAALGPDYKVFVGMRHWHPRIAEVVREMEGQSIRDGVALALTPQFSSLSVGAYLQALDEANSPIAFRRVLSWHLQPAYQDAMAARIHDAGEGWQPDMVVFTAHSLPRRTVEEGDPYVFQLQQTANSIAGRANLQRWVLSFQSASLTGEEWLGPDILQTIDRLAADGVERLLVAPIGFISDHLEILYDLDVLAKEHAESVGVELHRTQSLNADPLLVEALATAVRQAA